MEEPKLPSELQNLSPDQMAAVVEYAKKQAKSGEFGIASQSAGNREEMSTDKNPDKSESANSVPEPSENVVVSKELLTPESKTEKFDMGKVLSGDHGKIKDPGALLEQVLNMSQENNEDTAYKA